MANSTSARVLLVDAEDSNLEMLCLLLKAQGHQCSAARSASEAWVLCMRERFHCMLLHATLGGTSGIAPAERLSHETHSRPRHIILMSGRPKTDFLATLRAGVVDGFLRKPAEAEEVLDAVRRCLSP